MFEYLNLFITAILIIILLLDLVLNYIRMYYKNDVAPEIYQESKKKTPFVSIHIPCCNEPVEVVCSTIASVISQNYDAVEILVIYNNTADEMVWKPVQKYCERQSSIVKFINIPKIEGYKAGAMNYAMRYVDAKTDLIFTVDSDYILKENALATAVEIFNLENADLIQFPQAYYNINEGLGPLKNNFDLYFKWYLTRANKSGSALPTGTLTLINYQTLKDIGFWPTDSITEDAQLGVLMHANNKKCIYNPTVLGEGLMPENFEDLTIQRSRWAFGNIQVLRNLLFVKRINREKLVPIISQLTAWINLCAVPILILNLGVLYAVDIFAVNEFNILLATSIIFLYIFFRYLINVKSIVDHHQSFNMTMIDIALFETCAFSWLPVLLNFSKPFKRTNKFVSKNSRKPKSLLTVCFALVTVIFLYTGHIVSGTALGILTLTLGFAKIYTYVLLEYTAPQNLMTKLILLKKTVL